MLRRNPGLFIAACALLFVVALVYAVSTFAGSYVNGSPRSEAVYQWNGGTILLKNSSKSGRSCVVSPKQGEQRTVQFATSRTGRTDSVIELKPWFPSTATVRCGSSITVWSGWSVPLRQFTLSAAFVPLSAAVVAIPVLLAVFRSKRRV